MLSRDRIRPLDSFLFSLATVCSGLLKSTKAPPFGATGLNTPFSLRAATYVLVGSPYTVSIVQFT